MDHSLLRLRRLLRRLEHGARGTGADRLRDPATGGPDNRRPSLRPTRDLGDGPVPGRKATPVPGRGPDCSGVRRAVGRFHGGALPGTEARGPAGNRPPGPRRAWEVIRLPPAPGPAPASPRPSSRRQRTVLPPLPPRSPAPSGSVPLKHALLDVAEAVGIPFRVLTAHGWWRNNGMPVRVVRRLRTRVDVDPGSIPAAIEWTRKRFSPGNAVTNGKQSRSTPDGEQAAFAGLSVG